MEHAKMLENHSCLARSSMGGFSRLFRIHSTTHPSTWVLDGAPAGSNYCIGI